MAPLPRAWHTSSFGVLLLGAVPLTALLAWGVAHVYSTVAALASGSQGMVLPWLVSFLLLWWVPLSWLERPRTAPPQAQAALDRLKVTVQVPVYNEDPDVLRGCLHSLLVQTRTVNRIRIVDDGSVHDDGTPMTYDDVRAELFERTAARGVEVTWDRTVNRGKRHAQMHVLATDDADVFVTLDSDSILDPEAIAEGLKPFADPKVTSVAGQVVVLNHDANALTRMINLLYLPFTRGLRSAQSVLGRVTINSGTLAFYRAHVVRNAAGVYEHETFRGRPMQMNDDSMLTFYGLLAGDTVHQPSSLVFTLAPERWSHYMRQQMRWMRGTTVRHLWWLRYMPLTGIVFWSTIAEYVHITLGIAVPAVILADPDLRGHTGTLVTASIVIGTTMSYLMALRLFTVHRTDMRLRQALLLFALAPLASAWRALILRPMYFYAMATCHRVDRWGTRDHVEVTRPGNGHTTEQSTRSTAVPRQTPIRTAPTNDPLPEQDQNRTPR
ncbi:glycosyltransferase family 2 protein [Streptomyces sp. WI04-05B]|uniref:glycosyltransferase family 2 protein n=1 Tax=Streptomyces TaxID=1883 RepID=UPI0029A3C25F|nr:MULTISPECIES: glycosyltransferase family 2 protein [unclassified Streptomyces]MDX2546368.1 glycosyltransferase family 2 protein [Streptomyces sp. WI04-05B]MDX2589179.1 glycosyltransferase family 2 protein [Streptomyces sp. WI04-05A]